MNELAGWIAPVATIVAAMMTAANLGARMTGWGFVVFTLGSLCWISVGLATGQTNLIIANGTLTLVNLAGIWRWLGRQRTHEIGGKSAKAASHTNTVPTLFTATGIAGMPLVTMQGETLGKAVEALIECRLGTISYVVVATTTDMVIGEILRAVPAATITFQSDRLVLAGPRGTFDALPPLKPGRWPATADLPLAHEDGVAHRL